MEHLNLDQLSYDELYLNDYTYGGRIAEALTARGLDHKTVCPECGPRDFEHVEGCSKLSLVELENMNLAQMSYDQLFVQDYIYDGEVAQALNAQGLCRMTVCPECGVDDFTHVEGCSKLKLVEEI